MSAIETYDDLIKRLNKEAARMSSDYAQMFRTILTAGYNLGQYEAAQGIRRFIPYEKPKKEKDIEEIIKRLWEDDGK